MASQHVLYLILMRVEQVKQDEYEKALKNLRPKITEPLHFLNSAFYGEWQERARNRVLYLKFLDDKGELLGCGLAVAYVMPYGYYFYYFPYGPLATKWSDELIATIKQFFVDLHDKHLIFARLDNDSIATNMLKPASEAVARMSSLQPRNEWLLDITKSEEDLLKGMHKKARYHIKLASQKGATFRIEKCNDSQFEVFYDLLSSTAKRDGFHINPKTYYQTAFSVLKEHACVGFVDFENKPLATALCISYDKQTHYVFGATSDEYRDLSSGYLLQWGCIKEAIRLKNTIYNFGGISGGVKGEQLTGVTQFKQRFGGYQIKHDLPKDIILSNSKYRLFGLYKKIR